DAHWPGVGRFHPFPQVPPVAPAVVGPEKTGNALFPRLAVVHPAESRRGIEHSRPTGISHHAVDVWVATRLVTGPGSPAIRGAQDPADLQSDPPAGRIGAVQHNC